MPLSGFHCEVHRISISTRTPHVRGPQPQVATKHDLGASGHLRRLGTTPASFKPTPVKFGAPAYDARPSLSGASGCKGWRQGRRRRHRRASAPLGPAPPRAPRADQRGVARSASATQPDVKLAPRASACIHSCPAACVKQAVGGQTDGWQCRT